MKKIFSEARLKSKALYKFLKKHTCLREFVENIEFKHPDYEEVIKYKKLGDTNSLLLLFEKFSSSIEYAFIWRHTPQGHDYWHKLDRGFITYWFKLERDFNTYWLKLGKGDEDYWDNEHAAFEDYEDEDDD